jgi:group I intron endonuclease
MSQQFHYVYITTNIINGHQYVGDRSSICEPKEDKYLGSGILFGQKVNEYGKENFKKEILELFPTRKEAFDAQEKYIRLYKTHISQGGYNISWKGGHNVKDCWSEESKEKCRKTQTGKTGYMKDKHYSAEEKTRLYKNRKYPLTRKKQVQETKEKISKSLIGKTKGIKRKPLNKKHKEKLKKFNTGHKRQCGELNSQFGIKWLINPLTSETLATKKENVDQYLIKGWIYGRKLKK